MIHKFCVAIALAMLVAGPTVAMESYTIGAVDVYEAASADSKVIATIPEGQPVELQRCEAGWCLTSDLQPEGWVREEELRVRGGGV